MSHWHSRPWIKPFVIVAVLSLSASIIWGDSPAVDPVKRLRQLLEAQSTDPDVLDPAGAKRVVQSKDRTKAFVEEQVRLAKELVDSVTTLPQMKRALLIRGWSYRANDKGADVLQPIYQALLRRFGEKFRAALSDKPGPQRLAAISMIGEFGVKRPSYYDPPRIGRDFTKALAEFLRKDPTPRERILTARAIGESFPEPAAAVSALEMLLQSKEIEDRRAASDALATMNRAVQSIFQIDASSSRISDGMAVFIETARAVVSSVGRGLTDPDPMVRSHSAQAIRYAAKGFPARNALEVNQYDSNVHTTLQANAEAAYKSFLPLAQEIDKQSPGLCRLLGDADLDVVLAADEALEAIAEARKSWFEVAEVLGEKADPLAPGLHAALPGLEKQMSHADVRIRLGSLYVLESMGKDASPIAPAIARCMDDKDSFVRWAVARVFGAMAPLAAEHAVPALAKAVDDPNGDVLMSTLDALKRYGPAAGKAVLALSRAVGRGSPEMRVLVIQAIGAVGANGKEGANALVQALKSPHPTVRVAAAQALGKMAPADPKVVDALVLALDDVDSDVRSAAGESILSEP
jgi:HEAT repeat protein